MAASVQLVDSTSPEEGRLEYLHDAVLRSPSLFGRLVGIGLSHREYTRYSAAPEKEELKKLHLETFTNWLTLSLRSQTGDISIFLNSFSRTERTSKINQLIAIGQELIPPEAMLPERQLFLEDLKVVQNILRYEL